MTTTLRQMTLLAIRLAGIIFLIFGVFSIPEFVRVFVDAWQMRDHYTLTHFVMPLALLHRTLLTLTTLALGAVLCTYSGRLTLWLVPTPGARCLRCGHKLDPANHGTCPECSAETA